MQNTPRLVRCVKCYLETLIVFEQMRKDQAQHLLHHTNMSAL